jgi:hypothetical protein
MHDVRVWLILANAIVMGMVAYRGMVRSSLVPMRIPLHLVHSGAHRSR